MHCTIYLTQGCTEATVKLYRLWLRKPEDLPRSFQKFNTSAAGLRRMWGIFEKFCNPSNATNPTGILLSDTINPHETACGQLYTYPSPPFTVVHE